MSGMFFENMEKRQGEEMNSIVILSDCAFSLNEMISVAPDDWPGRPEWSKAMISLKNGILHTKETLPEVLQALRLARDEQVKK